jgi:hypothetical protein
MSVAAAHRGFRGAGSLGKPRRFVGDRKTVMQL